MAHYLRRRAAVFVIAALMAVAACATDDNPNDDDTALTTCDDDCIQPPLRKSDLLSHLEEHQERILARDDYKEIRPPSISETIFGPVIDDPVRAGPEIVDEMGNPFDGDIHWHYVDFDEVTTTGVDAPPSIRGRDVSGAHCYFGRKPNRKATIFALLAAHHPGGTDRFFLAGPHYSVRAVEDGPLSTASRGAVRLADEGLRCAFRHDQNGIGAIVVPFEYVGNAAAEGVHYAVYTVVPRGELRTTNRTVTVQRAIGITSDEFTTEIEIPVREYPSPNVEFVDSYADVYQAVSGADEAVPRGRFRLRPEFVYFTMPWQAYFSTGKEEFCPQHTECRIPSKFYDIDTYEPFPAELIEALSDREENTTDRDDGDRSDEPEPIDNPDDGDEGEGE